jgi:hypothetical protein
MPDKVPTPTDPFEAGRDRLRETVKWLIASFGAVGGSLAIGSQLSNLGQLEAGGRLIAAIAGAVAGFTGVFFAVWAAAKVLTGSHVTIGQLASRSRARSEGKDDVLVDFFEKENTQILGKYKSLSELQSDFLTVTRAADNAPDAARYDEVAERVKTVVNVASYEQLRERLDSGLTRIVWSVALAAVGIIVFAWAANPPAD